MHIVLAHRTCDIRLLLNALVLVDARESIQVETTGHAKHGSVPRYM